MVASIKKFRTSIFADSANIKEIKNLNKLGYIKGFTTNPTLIKNNNIKDYSSFSKKMIKEVGNKSISFEVISDDLEQIQRQALKISSWGKNVYVKIPITNTKQVSTNEIIKNLNTNNIKLNITAITTYEQVKLLKKVINFKTPTYISIFAGRIADTGRDPKIIIKKSIKIFKNHKNVKFIWASPRQIFNLIEAEEIGCHIITLTNDILNKIKFLNKDLDTYSLETVKMFYSDAIKSKLRI